MRLIFIADNAYPSLIKQLQTLGEVIMIPKSSYLYPGVENHVDLHIHIVDQIIFLSRSISDVLYNRLSTLGIDVRVIEEDLEAVYPKSAYLNALSLSEYFLHPKSITACKLKKHIDASSRKWINIKQGYARCAALPIADQALITADEGILNACKTTTLKLLKIQSAYVKLKHHTYGFIGGTAGQIQNIIFFNGDLTTHPDHQVIETFILKQGCSIFQVDGMPLQDIGSILVYEGDHL
ncbi:DUF6873 family GME fold protein [Petrocella sp. FN5]|uniref:DUF6873 family GME fold protein n=1 Tax=Petrocella sp. FN5 TaxID=3032002 RepID=UPI0023DA12AE|nr:hypothetical protein [Petrocella sp. FN5]MDF1618396.1 hypothetical protein [Petrocella sp. FN5]